MKKKIVLFLTVTSIVASILPVSAEISGDVANDYMEISVNLPQKYKNYDYSMYVFNPGMDENSIKSGASNKEAVQYFTQRTFNGSDTVRFKLNTKYVNNNLNPRYKVLITTDDYQETEIISAYSEEVKRELLTRVNAMSESDFSIIDEIADVFNLRGVELYKETENATIAKKLAVIVKKEAATESNIEKLFKNASLLAAVADGKAKIVEDGALSHNDILGIDASFDKLLKSVSAAGMEKMNNNIADASFDDIQSLAEAVKEECILRAIYSHNELGSGHIANIISEHSAYLSEKGVNCSQVSRHKKAQFF